LSVISAAFMAFCIACQSCPSKCAAGCAYGQILLVGEDQEESVPQLVFVEHALQLLTGLNNTVAIVAVNNEDDALSVLEVMPPQRSDLVLASDIPHGELDVLVLDGLNVEACIPLSTCARVGTWRGNIPIVGMVVTISPSLSLYRIVVFPAASKPTIRMRISFFPHSLSNSFENVRPMIAGCGLCCRVEKAVSVDS
jgi:hypothetical protein